MSVWGIDRLACTLVWLRPRTSGNPEVSQIHLAISIKSYALSRTYNVKNVYFDQHFGCTAPKRWSKYSTVKNKLFNP